MKIHALKDVDAAIKTALKMGWRWVEKGNGHTVGYLYCTASSSGGHEENTCCIPVFGSPKNSGNHAKKIRKAVENHSC